MLAGIAGSAALLGLYARGGPWAVLGFVALVPWLRALDCTTSVRAALLQGWAMSVAMMLAVFSWFGVAIGEFTGIGTASGVLLLLMLAPLLQPQLLVFAGLRVLAGRRYGHAMRAVAAGAAWVAAEWALPDLLGDTLGHGLFPAALLRQAADLGGVAGLTLALLLVNEAVAAALARRARPGKRLLRPLAVALLVPALMAGYGALRLHQLAALERAQPATPLRVGVVQANITGYERLREQVGAYAVVRRVLDTHYAMSRELLDAGQVDALLWSETVYPTTFGQPKSDGGAELDAELAGFVRASAVPLVFGTYDRDASGEYNSAAFLEASGALLGQYRKARPFPLTEYVPAWLDGPLLRRWLPWAGTWRAGDGARVFPLRLADGREIPVVPLICLDDTDPRLAIDGARLGAQAILGMSNDSWFTRHPVGARLHLAVAGFRSIETRLPQMRATANGISASIDATGSVLAQTAMDQRAVLVGDVAARAPLPTLMVKWGDWVGPVALVGLLLLGLVPVLRRLLPLRAQACPAAGNPAPLPTLQAATVLPAGWRRLAVCLQAVATTTLLALLCILLLRDDLRANSLWALRLAAALVMAPALAAWCIRQAFAAELAITDGALRISGRDRDTRVPLASLRTLEPWWLPWPGQGMWVRLQSGRHWSEGVVVDGEALAHALSDAGKQVPFAPGTATRVAQARWRVRRWWFDRPLVKF
ncbi:MAG: apolipoprotein N-acyltransferase, partial [Pseudomonadota bacterium]